MRAWLSEVVGGPQSLVLRDVDPPVPAESEVVVDVAAVGINFTDFLFIQDLYQVRPERPFPPGAEFSGIVSAVGAGVEHLTIGDHVIGRCGWGAMVEKILVLGSSGGIGTAAIDLGRALSAKVYAAASSQEKLDFALSRGCEGGVVYPRELDGDTSRAFAKDLKTLLGPGGAQIVVDPIGGDYAEPALRSLGKGGRHLVLGFTAGVPKIPLNLTLLKSCSIVGVDWRSYVLEYPEGARADCEELLELYQNGLLRPAISDIYPFAEAPDAIARIGNRSAQGKMIVTV